MDRDTYRHTVTNDTHRPGRPQATPRAGAGAGATPSVSVVVGTYNRASSLRQTLNSLAALDTRGLRGEFIIVDNNSSDDTRAVIEAFLPLAPLPARYMFEPHQGVSYARNTGIDAASSEVIAFTDDDVLVDRNWLQEIARAFALENPAAIGGKIVPQWPASPPAWLGPELHQFLGLLDYGDEPKTMETPALWGANLAVRADMLRTVRFQGKLGRVGSKLYNGEDADLVRSLIDRGERVLYWPRASVHHNIQRRAAHQTLLPPVALGCRRDGGAGRAPAHLAIAARRPLSHVSQHGARAGRLVAPQARAQRRCIPVGTAAHARRRLCHDAHARPAPARLAPGYGRNYFRGRS